jgi:lysine N6-hydroxylase
MLGRDVLHAGDFLHEQPATAGRRVLVVGGGQSGAEIVAHLLCEARARPASLVWTSRRHGFAPLDDSPFANEWFNPRHVEYFQALPAARRRELVALQCYASDGISEDLLARIYRRLYELDFVDGVAFAHRLLPGHELVDVAEGSGARHVVLRNADTGALEAMDADVVVLATGYEAALPDCIAELAPLFPAAVDDSLDEHYRLPWAGAPGHAIYVQNGGRLSHGVADSNLSLACWRAATILNAVCGRPVLRTDRGDATIAWPATARAAIAGDAPVKALP